MKINNFFQFFHTQNIFSLSRGGKRDRDREAASKSRAFFVRDFLLGLRLQLLHARKRRTQLKTTKAAQNENEWKAQMLHGPKRGREGERERERQHERARAGTRENSFLFGLRLCLKQEQHNRSHACFYFGELYNTALHTQTLPDSVQAKALCQTCCSCYCALSLSRMHCVKLAPLIVVAAVHFNALFRTPFPSFSLLRLSAFAVAIWMRLLIKSSCHLVERVYELSWGRFGSPIRIYLNWFRS